MPPDPENYLPIFYLFTIFVEATEQNFWLVMFMYTKCRLVSVSDSQRRSSVVSGQEQENDSSATAQVDTLHHQKT